MQCKDLSLEHEQILRPFPSLFLHPLPLVVGLSQTVDRPTLKEKEDQIEKVQVLVIITCNEYQYKTDLLA